MKVVDLLSIMNIADVGLCSEKIYELLPERKINMFDWRNDPLVAKYGDYEVKKLTNVAKLGDTIWI